MKINLRTVPLNTEVFLSVYDYEGKTDLDKGYWNPERKLGITTHVSEVIRQRQ